MTIYLLMLGLHLEIGGTEKRTHARRRQFSLKDPHLRGKRILQNTPLEATIKPTSV